MPDRCCEELSILTGSNYTTKAYMTPVSNRVTSYCTPRLCSSAMPAGYHIGTQDSPQWMYVGATGEPFLRKVPLELHAQKILRTGLVSASEEGMK